MVMTPVSADCIGLGLFLCPYLPQSRDETRSLRLSLKVSLAEDINYAFNKIPQVFNFMTSIDKYLGKFSLNLKPCEKHVETCRVMHQSKLFRLSLNITSEVCL